jgi:hypothetical protein
MALYHVHAAVISKGKSPGGSTGFAQYIAREQSDKATQYARYVHREGYSRDDLVAWGDSTLPAWARDGAHFFFMADRYEQQRGVVARTYEIALPRELSQEARVALAADIRAVFFERYPMRWAMHNPIDQTKEGIEREHPHMHVMIQERRTVDGIDRGPQQYFARAARPGQDPASHGVRKEASWAGPARLRELRAGIATLVNAALEREGLALAVSHQSLEARALERHGSHYRLKDGEPAKTKAHVDREVLRRAYHPLERDMDLLAWYDQKAREGIRDLSREAMVDHVRDRFWQQDRSPAREREREESLLRAIEREYARTGRARAQAPVWEVHRELVRRGQRHQGVVQGMSLDDTPQGGAQVHLQDHELEREVGYGHG